MGNSFPLPDLQTLIGTLRPSIVTVITISDKYGDFFVIKDIVNYFPSDPQLRPVIIISDKHEELFSIAGPSDPHWDPQTVNYGW